MLSRLFKKSIPQDQREHYRSALGRGAALGVKMICGNGAPVSGALVDLSAGGAAIEFDSPLPDGELEEGVERELVFSSLTSRSVRAMAGVRSLPREGGPERYGFHFVDAAAVFEQLDDSFYKFFNRRRYRRAKPGIGENLRADVAFGSVAETVKVCDLSIGGLAFYVAPDLAHALAIDVPVEVQLPIPGTDHVVTMHGHVRHVTSDARGTRVGLAVEIDPGDGSKRSMRRAECALTDYIQRRIDDMERYNTAYN